MSGRPTARTAATDDSQSQRPEGRERMDTMKLTLLEVSQLRSTLQVLWHNATPEVKAAFLADDDSPEKLIEMIDQKIDEYAEEIRKALADRKEA